MRSYKNILFLLLSIVLCFAISSCENDASAPTPTGKRGELVATEQLADLTTDDIARLAGDSLDKKYIQYGVKAFKLTYWTLYETTPIRSTALLLIPKDAPEQRFTCYMHGTNAPIPFIIPELNEPTAYNFNRTTPKGEVSSMGLPLAASGYTVVMPDYIGFGATSHLEHPFVYYPELDKAILDAMRAAKNYLGCTGKTPVWLGGWSQGGGASLSMHYYLQTEDSAEFRVVASSSLAGPYSFTRFVRELFLHPDADYAAVVLYTWAAYSVNRFGVHRPNDQIFTFPVSDQVDAILAVKGRPDELFRPYFIDGILNDWDVVWMDAMNKNSFCTGWKPEGKVFLHHGTADNIVPYFNTEDAYNGLKESGADVTLYPYEGGQHFQLNYRYIQQTIDDFNQTHP